MHLIGLTGGIGSGKSTVAKRFIELGAVIVDADQVSREVVAVGEPTLDMIADRFGDDILNTDGTLNRQALASIVFRNDAALQDLERIMHPPISERTAERFVSAVADGADVVIHDSPLLIEHNSMHMYEKIVVVMASHDVRIERLTTLRGLSQPDVIARMAQQVNDTVRRNIADFIVDNDGTLSETHFQVDEIWDQLTS